MAVIVKKKAETSKAPTKVVAKKKVTTTSAKAKAPVKKAAAPAPKATAARKPVDREYGDHGFVKGTDFDIAADLLVNSTGSKADVAAALDKKFKGKTTSRGNAKDSMAIIASTVHHLRAKGYKVEETYRVVPPKKRGSK